MAEKPKKHLFVLYAPNDAGIVKNFVELLGHDFALRRIPVDIWMDRSALRPGESWQEMIESALRESVGMLVFISPALLLSDWARRELEVMLADESKCIVPVMIEHTKDYSWVLQERIYFDISSARFDEEKLHRIVYEIASNVGYWLHNRQSISLLKETDAQGFAAFAAENVRSATSQERDVSQSLPDSVFVVHGHDTDTLQIVSDTLLTLGVRPVVLSQLEGSEQSLLQKFFTFSKQARFAIVILSSDDYGASRLQYETDGVADRALQFRARQNVILELGFFYGYLGWENVFVLFKKSSKVFPNFERPSDLDGAVFDPIDGDGKWKGVLVRKLQAAGFQLRE